MATTNTLRTALLDWYRQRKRDLPWRRTQEPYRIWVAEVMLQQTRVEAVKPYYQRFTARFPTLEALAEAPLDDVLAHWSGLGYYQRARSLHTAVRECRERYGGEVPSDACDFIGLKGVGAYTQAAVLSIAFGAPLAAVDGNVVRVLARLDRLAGHRREPALIAAVRARAETLLDPDRPGDFNQAMMELGATLCTPKRPRCDVCPWSLSCRARAAGDPERWPAPAPREQVREVTWRAALVSRGDAILLVQRGTEGRLKGMWELPWTGGAWRTLGPKHGLRLQRGARAARIRHGILNERITLLVYRATLERPPPASAGISWVAPGELGAYASSSVWRKVYRACGLMPGGVKRGG